MKGLDLVVQKAKKNPKKIILPEGDDARVVEAGCIAAKKGIAKIIFLGKKSFVEKTAESKSFTFKGIEIVEPESASFLKEISNTFYELRKHKGVTEEEALQAVINNKVFFGALMTRLDMADGFVAGASHTTADVARGALYCLKLDPEVKTLSSSFLIELDGCVYGENGLFVFADCGIIPEPTAEQLAGIAISSSQLMQMLFDVEPKAAFLSYSTKGSAKGGSIDRIHEAIKIVSEREPNLKIDGELQIDAALVPEVAKIKAPESPIAGKANVLVFPNLDSGNISYKLMQRLAKARVAGPILQGLTKPASDLSRGCEIEEIVDVIAVTVVRAQNIKA